MTSERDGGDAVDYDELLCRITSREEHPVMECVRRFPFESASYPANMYHGTEEGVRPDAGKGGRITWCPPAHDHERPKQKGCGFIREPNSGEKGIHYTACTHNQEHYAKGRRSHCWSMSCPVCANDTALRNGSRVEERLNTYRVLMEKRGTDPGPLGHWVVSPDQEYAKTAMQNIDDYTEMRKRIEKGLQDAGAAAGVLVFHPWRQKDCFWELSPHFHSILFGFLDTDRFREEHPGWIIKKVHADEELESIGQTAAYLFTHMGLGLAERDVSEIDYGYRFLCLMLPGLYDDDYRSTVGPDGTYGAGSGRAFRFSEEDCSRMAEGKGKMAGDVSDVDWLEFTAKPLCYAVRISYFGLASNRNIRTVANDRERRTRVCRECGHPLYVYSGVADIDGEAASFNFDNTVRTFSFDYSYVKEAVDSCRESGSGGESLSSIAPKTALIVSKDEVMPYQAGVKGTVQKS